MIDVKDLHRPGYFGRAKAKRIAKLNSRYGVFLVPLKKNEPATNDEFCTRVGSDEPITSIKDDISDSRTPELGWPEFR